MSKEDVTLGECKELHNEISKLKTIGELKRCVKAFAVKHDITDTEAIDIANMGK